MRRKEISASPGLPNNARQSPLLVAYIEPGMAPDDFVEDFKRLSAVPSIPGGDALSDLPLCGVPRVWHLMTVEEPRMAPDPAGCPLGRRGSQRD